jgi:hypothetical protein
VYYEITTEDFLVKEKLLVLEKKETTMENISLQYDLSNHQIEDKYANLLVYLWPSKIGQKRRRRIGAEFPGQGSSKKRPRNT